MELALFDGLFFVRVGQIPQLKPAKGLLLSPSANAASRPGLQIDRLLLADERYAKKIAVRYAAAVLKPMSARRLSLPRARYGGAHH